MKYPRLVLIFIALAVGCATGAPQSRLAPIPPEKPFTFIVVGDNRGASSGEPAPVFLEILQAINAASPNLVLNTGDMVNGYKGDSEAVLRQQWKGYTEAIAQLKMPFFHVPGNHDLYDEQSARVWKELLGPTYYSFDYGRARFIALDTETEPGRLGTTQFEWLRKQLAEAGNRHVFLFFHRPLFPVDGHIGSSLDQFPNDRDRLHQLFVQYRKIIKGVYQGHEHMYNFEERDGIPYYIIGGGGAELYVPPEVGGFYHYVMVSVAGDQVSTKVKRMGEETEAPKAVTQISPGALLESWEDGLFWYTWDQSVKKELTRDQAAEGRQGLKVHFDLSKYEYPLIYVPQYPAWDLSKVDRLSVEIYVPKELRNKLSVNPIVEGAVGYEAPSVSLKPGWNTVPIDLNAAWLPKEERSKAKQLQWVLFSEDKKLAGWVVFDNLKAEMMKAKAEPQANPRLQSQAGGPSITQGLLESWEGSLIWGAYNETVMQETTPEFTTQGQRGLKVRFDFSKFNRPIIYAPLNPLWDLRRVKTLTLDVYAPENVAGTLQVNLVIVGQGEKHQAPTWTLKPGWNKIMTHLDGTWLPAQTRGAAEQVEWVLSTSNKKLAGWVVFDNFRAGAG